jgi:hypothetical protein
MVDDDPIEDSFAGARDREERFVTRLEYLRSGDGPAAFRWLPPQKPFVAAMRRAGG